MGHREYVNVVNTTIYDDYIRFLLDIIHYVEIFGIYILINSRYSPYGEYYGIYISTFNQEDQKKIEDFIKDYKK